MIVGTSLWSVFHSTSGHAAAGREQSRTHCEINFTPRCPPALRAARNDKRMEYQPARPIGDIIRERDNRSRRFLREN